MLTRAAYRCSCVTFPAAKAKKEVEEAPKFVPFAGGGARLDGKKMPTKGTEEGKEGKESEGARRQCETGTARADSRIGSLVVLSWHIVR